MCVICHLVWKEHFYFENLKIAEDYRGINKKTTISILSILFFFHSTPFAVKGIFPCLFLSATRRGDACCKISYFMTKRRTVTELHRREQQDESAKWHRRDPDRPWAGPLQGWLLDIRQTCPSPSHSGSFCTVPMCSHHNLHTCKAEQVAVSRTLF